MHGKLELYTDGDSIVDTQTLKNKGGELVSHRYGEKHFSWTLESTEQIIKALKIVSEKIEEHKNKKSNTLPATQQPKQPQIS